MSLIRAPRAIPEFAFAALPNGVGNLSPYLTINSTKVAASLRYKCGDANATNLVAWQFGATLALQAGTAPSYNQGSPLMGVDDDSVLFNGGGYYLCGDTTTGNVSTDDIVIEAVFKIWTLLDGDYYDTLAAKRNTGNGWEFGIYVDADPNLYFTIQDEDGSVTTSSATLTDYTFRPWYHVLIFADRSGSSQIYVNGAVSGVAADISACEKTLDAADSLSVGSDSGGNSDSRGYLAYFSMWHGAAWLDTHLQTAIAADRFAILTGSYPQIASGTATPITTTRAYKKYITKYNTATSKYDLYYVGDNWLCTDRLLDLNGNVVSGFNCEQGVENIIEESEDFATTWVITDGGGSVSSNALACPDGRIVADGLIADTDDEPHSIYFDTTLTVATYTYSVFLRPGNKPWALVSDDTGNSYCYFDITNGELGSSLNLISARISPCKYYGDFYRCEITFTGTVAGHYLSICPANGDGDESFAGDGVTVNIYMWGAQCELGEKATSPIITDGGAATRLKDELGFDVDNVADSVASDELRIEFDVLVNETTLESDVVLLSIGGGVPD